MSPELDSRLAGLADDGPRRTNSNVRPTPEPELGRKNITIKRKTSTIKNTLLRRGSPPVSLNGAMGVSFLLYARYIVLSLYARG